ncbi:MAG: PQQ-binding-like beta-propeller repeat protein [Planctomycetota bacterium]
MSLRGNLNSVDLANIFQMLSINQKEGTLNIFDGDSKKSIYFSRQGVSMLSRGKAKKDTLGQILLRYDRVNGEQLERALEKQRQTGQLLGAILEESGLVSSDVIEDALRIQIEEEVYNLFVWKDASFEFIEGAPPPEFDTFDGVTQLTFNVNSLIMEAARRVDEWEQIQRVVPSTSEIYRYSGRNMELSDDIFREAYCEKVLAAINGKHTVDEIIDRSFVNRFEVCRILSLLLEQSAIEAVSPEDLVGLAEASISRGDAPEAAKFLERVVELGADTPETHQSLGEAYESMKQIRNAAAHYRMNAEHRVSTGEPGLALDLYRKICELLPTDLRSAERLIEIYVEHEGKIKADPAEIVERGKALATIFQELRRLSSAVTTLHRVIGLAPEDFSLRHLLINIYLANSMPKEAVAEYESMAAWFTKKKDIDQVIKILRKILVIDRKREDVHQRLQALILKKEKKKQGVKRLFVTVVLLVGASVLAYGYGTYEIEARANISQAESEASKVIEQQNRLVEPALSKLQELRGRITEPGKVGTPELVEACRRVADLRDGYQREIQAAIDSLAEVGSRYKFTTANKHAHERQDDLRHFLREFDGSLEWAREETQKRVVLMERRARELEEMGQFRKADEILRTAWEIAPDRDYLIGKSVDRRLADFEENFRRIEASVARIEQHVENEEFGAARAAGIRLIGDYSFLEVIERVPLPVQVETLPAGAAIFVNGTDTGKRTPAWITWNATETTEVTLKLRGFNDATQRIHGLDDERIGPETNRVCSLDRITWEFHKETIWETALSGAVEAEPTRVGDMIYIATRNGLVYRVDVSKMQLSVVYDGRNASLSGLAASPLIHDGQMYLALVEGKLLKVDPEDGKVAWAKPVPGRVYAPLSISGQMLFVGDASGHLTAWDAPSGELLWKRTVTGEIRSRPVVSDGRVYVTTSRGHLYAFDLSGAPVWEARPGGDRQARLGTPMLGDGRLYVCGSDGVLYALDPSTRKLIWSCRVPAEVRSDPVRGGGLFFLGAMDGHVYAIREGRLVAKLEVGGAVLASPAVSGNRVIALSDSGRILRAEFSENKFRTLWRYELDKTSEQGLRMEVAPVLTGDRVLVIPESGQLFLLKD